GERGGRWKENGRMKASAAGTAAGLPAFADDSGLTVDALDGDPGIYSARWAGPEKDFRRAMRAVEDKLRERGARERGQRKAHFVSALCLAWPDGHVEEFEGTGDGTLAWAPRGEQGFGYDPMFWASGQSGRCGEMTKLEKHGLPARGKGLSHRVRAFLKLAEACLAAR